MAVDGLSGVLDSWETRNLDEVATIIDSLHKTPAYSEQGLPMVRVTDIRGGFLDLSGTLKVCESVFAEFTRRHRPRRGDIVFSRVGTYGNASYVASDDPFCLGQNTVLIHASINSRFLHYCLQSPAVRKQIEHSVVGSTQKTISLRSISALQIAVPPNPELEAIAHILGTLDDKIELNRRMSETLEAMVRALFKSWFVDFDPVRAKAEGRDPGLPKRLADLFPARLVHSELGEIPEGWEVGSLGDVLVQIVDRCVPSDETRSRPYVPIECIAARSLLLAESKPGEEAQSSLTKFRKGDLLFGAMRPYFHKVAIAPFDGTTRTTAFVLRPREPKDFGYVALLLHDPKTIEYATNHSTGSTIPYAVWQGSLEAMPTVLPPRRLRVAFDEFVRAFLDRIPPIFFENCTLADLRDALLPKLISGELRVEDPERFLRGGD